MMKEPLPPIPTPPTQFMRQLRQQYLPIAVFVIGLIAAAFIWSHYVAPPTLVGEVEAIRTEVRAPASGAVVKLEVDALQPVKAGQILGQVAGNPQVLEASAAVLRAEMDIIRTTMDPISSQQRLALDRQRLQLDWLTKRVELVALQGQLIEAEATLARIAVMHDSKLVTEQQFDEAKNRRDSFKAQVAAQTDLLKQMEPGMRSLDADGSKLMPTTEQALATALKRKEEEVRLLEVQHGPMPLVAPIDGVVTVIHRRAGEIVNSGDPIVQVAAAHSERIVGFIRQPITFEPKPGMTVEVRTRTFQRKGGTAKITGVGEQLEPITPTLLTAMRLPVSSVATELGLRVQIATPHGVALRPGEQVDLIIHD